MSEFGILVLCMPSQCHGLLGHTFLMLLYSDLSSSISDFVTVNWRRVYPSNQRETELNTSKSDPGPGPLPGAYLKIITLSSLAAVWEACLYHCKLY